MGIWPENDYRSYLEHSAKGSHWKSGHKYIAIKNGRYIYADNSKTSGRGSKHSKYGEGNVDLTSLPMIRNEDGSYETLDTFSVEIDGKQVLLNCIQMGPDGKAVRVTEDQAVDKYMKDGLHLGKFDTPDKATEYAKKLDKDQEKIRAERLSKSNNSQYAVVSGGKHYKTKKLKSALRTPLSGSSGPNVIYAPRKKVRKRSNKK